MAIEFGQRLKIGAEPMRKSWKRFRKYDGHSAIWLPKSQDLSAGISGLWSLGRSKQPESIVVPMKWLDALPQDIALHGELWSDDDRPSTVTSALKDSPLESDWEKLRLVVFAFPSNSTFDPADPKTFSNVNSDVSWKRAERPIGEYLHYPKEVERGDDLKYGWEGVVFQNPRARYRIGRSDDVLKCKPYYDDECEVVGYTEGKAGKTGNRLGTTGALVVRWKMTEKLLGIHGAELKFLDLGYKTFKLSGMNEGEWCRAEEAFPLGSKVKFKFFALTGKGTPQFCSIFREDS